MAIHSLDFPLSCCECSVRDTSQKSGTCQGSCNCNLAGSPGEKFEKRNDFGRWERGGQVEPTFSEEFPCNHIGQICPNALLGILSDTAVPLVFNEASIITFGLSAQERRRFQYLRFAPFCPAFLPLFLQF